MLTFLHFKNLLCTDHSEEVNEKLCCLLKTSQINIKIVIWTKSLINSTIYWKTTINFGIIFRWQIHCEFNLSRETSHLYTVYMKSGFLSIRKYFIFYLLNVLYLLICFWINKINKREHVANKLKHVTRDNFDTIFKKKCFCNIYGMMHSASISMF